MKAVNTVVMMPMPSVTAKPRTGPVPMKNSTAAAMKVVMFESRMVASARVKPGVDGGDRRAPGAHLLADALVDQHVAVDRDADGEHDADDARQRQRRVEQRQDAEDHRHVDGHRDAREHAEQPVGHDHEDDDQRGAEIGRILPFSIESWPRPGADHALLDHGELGRQRARAQQNGEIVGGLHREVAGDLPAAAEDRLADDRRRDHLVVEHDGERPADILLRDLGELARARGVELERDDRLAGALVEAGLRIGESSPDTITRFSSR